MLDEGRGGKGRGGFEKQVGSICGVETLGVGIVIERYFWVMNKL